MLGKLSPGYQWQKVSLFEQPAGTTSGTYGLIGIGPSMLCHPTSGKAMMTFYSKEEYDDQSNKDEQAGIFIFLYRSLAQQCYRTNCVTIA